MVETALGDRLAGLVGLVVGGPAVIARRKARAEVDQGFRRAHQEGPVGREVISQAQEKIAAAGVSGLGSFSAGTGSGSARGLTSLGFAGASAAEADVIAGPVAVPHHLCGACSGDCCGTNTFTGPASPTLTM